MNTNSLTGLLTLWEGLLAAVNTHKEDLAHLESVRDRLETGVADARALIERRSELREELQRITWNLEDFRKQGQDLAARIQGGALAVYGRRDEILSEFGLKPLGARKERASRNPTAP